jgi:ferredoxin-NADP reductase
MLQVKKYKAEVVSILNPVDDIFTVTLKSKSGKFRYLPGQFLHLALDEYDPSFGWPESRCFSMQSSPANDFIQITYSVKGRFTARMAGKLITGMTLDIKLPYGELFQQEHPRENAVFIAGGTGITPFLSAFTDPSFSEYSNPKLYFGVREKKFNIYSSYLNLAMQKNPNLDIITIYQDTDGILDIDQIFKETGLVGTFFISGPQKMISLFKSKLILHGVGEVNVKTDEWE